MSIKSTHISWSEDLKLARNVADSHRQGFEMLLSWFEDWRISRQLPSGREAACAFWRQQVKVKPRTEWQIDQWKQAISWYLEWLCRGTTGEHEEIHGGLVRSGCCGMNSALRFAGRSARRTCLKPGRLKPASLWPIPHAGQTTVNACEAGLNNGQPSHSPHHFAKALSFAFPPLTR
jgi:hypothetical protein